VSEPVRAVLSLGSNLGDRERILRAAVDDIGDLAAVDVVAVSSLVETPAIKPHGVDTAAPRYLNLVAEVSTTLSPGELLTALNRIEHRHGRVREVTWGDRTIDIDIVSMGELELSTESLTLPHPRALERGFVLVPWLEIDPKATLPGIGAIDRLPAAHEDVPRYRAEADS
jgi:2-amino-4-hydroxy-6-hydroxymethyldihydropteridine diphosphokinase